MPRRAFEDPPVPTRSLLLAALLLLVGCGGRSAPPAPPSADVLGRMGLRDASTPDALAQAAERLATVPLDAPPVPGEGYDPTFPPDLPFDPSAWQTNPPAPSIGDPRAKPGGRLVLATTDWPPTLRTEGPNSRLLLTFQLQSMVYETLLGIDPVSLEFVPGLARYWQVDPDKRTYRFRIDERARWADGRPVTADDVLATVEHLRNPDRKDPLVCTKWNQLVEYVHVLDRLTVEIRTKEARWRALLEIGNQFIYPAAYIRMDGETYIQDWNWKLPPGSGPYEIRSADVKKGRAITLHRRADWWGRDLAQNRGTCNFDEIEWQIVRDFELMYTKFLAGEIDVYLVSRAQRWVEEVNAEHAVRMGWIQKRKIYYKVPEGYGGFCFNLREPPFDKRNVRLAFAHLFNREKLFDKILFHQYLYMDSYWPGQKWARPNAERVRYDPAKARALLAEEGWTHRDKAGFLVNDRGERFPTLTLEFSSDSWIRIFGVVTNDLFNEAGIKMELKLLDDASLLKKVWDFKFKVAWWFWSASLFPEPYEELHSIYADQKGSNNLNGLKNKEIDDLCVKYRTEWDAKARMRMLQRIDEILFDTHMYALAWYAPYFRILYWDKFGHPPEYAARVTDDLTNLMSYWWADPEREQRMLHNRSANLPTYPDSPWGLDQEDDPEQTWWNDHDLPMANTPVSEGGTLVPEPSR